MSDNDAIYVGVSVNNLKSIPRQPTNISYSLMDISSSDAGRVQDSNNTMYKMRVGQKRKISLSWNNLSISDASAILKAFNPEYVYVRYIDVLNGNWNIRQFYVGDRSGVFKQITLPNGTVIKSVSFDIIEV